MKEQAGVGLENGPEVGSEVGFGTELEIVCVAGPEVVLEVEPEFELEIELEVGFEVGLEIFFPVLDNAFHSERVAKAGLDRN